MKPLSLTLFGSFRAQLGGQSIPGFRTKATQALLIYLAVSPDHPHNRDQLMTLLWPGMPQKSARANLRQTLYQLRQDIPGLKARRGDVEADPVIANRQDIQLNPDGDIHIDVIRFETLLNQTANHDHPDLFICQECRQLFEQAVMLYQGHFLNDFYLEDSNDFEDWAQSRREYYRRRVLDSLGILTTMAIRRKEYPQAQQTAEQQLQIDNLNEGAYRQLMEVLALNGRREEALATYEKCRRVLAEELGMAPTRRTTELYEEILAGEFHFHSVEQHDVRGYELKELIAEGGHGAVHRAVQTVIGREVAVKVIRRQYADDPDFIRRFEAEAQIVARLEHPHIVPLYDYWRDPNGAYLVMRYMRHGSLLSALETGAWDTARAAGLLKQIAGALTTAHQKGVVHRDIKPGNILLDEAGNAYLTDFGIAKDLHNQERLTAENAVVGTLDYASPEQIVNGEITPQSDIYSLGAVAYEILTGEKPFADDSIANLLYNHLNNPMPLVTASRPDIPVAVDTVLQKATAKKAAERYATAEEMAAAFFAAVGVSKVGQVDDTAAFPLAEVVDIYNPYKGLRAFQEADADDFFGRDSLVQQLVDQLGESDDRFLAIVGPSGSGKSSVVKAGLIPALRGGALPGSERWFTAVMVPGTHPLEELELALWPVAVDPPPSLVEPMERDTRGLLRTLRRILPEGDGSQPQLLLIIDQFEELFTLVESAERREFFLDSLLAALSAPRSPLRVIITLRADFYDRPLLHQDWGRIIKDNTEIVLPLNHSELTWAVREPARRMGVRIEDELVTTIVGDVSGQLGALPLLQYALTELFERREGGLIGKGAYQAIGGVQGALGRKAEAIYESLDENSREATRQLFLRLVTLGEGSEDTRRRVLRTELELLGLPNSVLDIVLDGFGQARLLTFDRDPTSRTPTVEVAHEALLREWPRLRGWLEQSRDDVRLQRMLAQAAGEWKTAEKDDAYLLRGSRLDQFGDWSEETQLALTLDEKQFLAASLAARTIRQEEEETRRQRELEAARQLAKSEKARADEQAQAAGRLRQRAVLLGSAMVVAAMLAMAAFFFAQRSNENAQTAQENADAAATSEAQALANAELAADNEAEAIMNLDLATTREAEAIAAQISAISAQATAQAEAVSRATAEAIAIEEREIALEQANLARSRELALASNNTQSTDVELSILLALEAITVGDTVEALNALHASVLGLRVQHRISAHEQTIYGSAYSPDGILLALISRDGTLSVWNAESGERLFNTSVNIPPYGAFLPINFSPDGDRLATVEPGDNLIISFWDTTNWMRLESLTLPISTEGMTDYEFSPDWTELAVGFANGTTQIWNLTDQQFYAELEEQTGLIEPYFSDDGQLLATANYNENTILIWNVATTTIVGRLDLDLAALFLSFSHDSHWLAVGINSGVLLWDLEALNQEGSQPTPIMLRGHEAVVYGLDFSPNGLLLASGGADSTVRLWNVATGENLLTLPQGSGVTSLAFHPNGGQLLTSDDEGNALIWDITPIGPDERLGWTAHDELIRSVALSSDQRYLAVASFDDSASIWDLVTGQEMVRLEGHLDNVRGIDYHPDGSRVATASIDGTARVWDVETGQELLVLEGHGTEVVGGGIVQGVMDIRYSPSGDKLVTVGSDQLARVWDAESGELLLVLEGHTGGLTTVAYSPNGRYIATGSSDRENLVRVWNAETGEPLFVIPVTHNATWGLEFSPDGHLLATAGSDRTAKIWRLNFETNSAELLVTLTTFNAAVSDVNFGVDGLTMATITGRETKVWDISALYGDVNNSEIPELLTLPGGMELAYNLDMNELIIAGADGLVRTYLLDARELQALARSRVTRTFTAEECRQYRIDPCPAET